MSKVRFRPRPVDMWVPGHGWVLDGITPNWLALAAKHADMHGDLHEPVSRRAGCRPRRCSGRPHRLVWILAQAYLTVAAERSPSELLQEAAPSMASAQN